MPATDWRGQEATAAPPRGLSAEAVHRLLTVISETPAGLRNRALILTMVLTGRLEGGGFWWSTALGPPPSPPLRQHPPLPVMACPSR